MYLPRIFPTPKQFEELESAPFTFGKNVKMDAPSALTKSECETVKNLWNGFSFTASYLEVECTNDDWTAVIGEAQTDDREVEYYTIKSNESGIIVRAIDEKSFIDAITTLVQLITPVNLDMDSEQFYIKPTLISDKPIVNFRSIHLCIFPESEVSTIEKAIKMAGFLKMTHVVLEFWGTFPYKNPAFSWKNYVWSMDTIKHIASLANAYGMEVIPMLNQLGHATQSRVSMGRHTILNSNPRLQMYFEPDGWTWCVSNPDTAKLLAEMRSELCDALGSGKYFHIGCDEAYSFGTCEKCRKYAPHELLAEHINRLTKELAADGRRPIMWHDELINHADFENPNTSVVANGQSHGTAPALDLLDRRVIIADWQYDLRYTDNKTTPYFMEKGFDTVVCPWDSYANIDALCKNAREMNTYGVMLTTWHHLPAYLVKMPHASEVMWQSVNTYYQGTDAAAILRKLHYSPDFESAGWNKFEVEQ